MGLTIAQISQECCANGGVGAYLLRLYPALAEAGHRVIVVHADRTVGREGVPGAYQSFYVADFDQFTPAGDCPVRAAAVLEILERVAPDVVHVQRNNNFVLDAALRA